MTTTAEHIAAIREALEAGPMPGEWKSVSAPHFDSGLVYASVQPVTADAETMKPLAMMNGEFHVCRMSHTAAEWRFIYHRRNAAYVAACNPVAMTAVLAELDRLKSENERMQRLLGSLDWYWPEDDTSSDACADGPWQIAENCDVLTGEVFGYSRGGVVETRYYGFLEAAEDAGTDDRFEVDEPTREAAEAKINAELHRRAAPKGDNNDD